MQEGAAIVQFFQTIGLMGVLVTLAVPSIRKKLWGMNGNGHQEELLSRMDILETNHLHHLQEELKELHRKEEEGNQISREILIILKDMRDGYRRK